jgi:signal transduction histidine kinase/purine-cytosine permease-like protein/FixJ family two-component response regulator
MRRAVSQPGVYALWLSFDHATAFMNPPDVALPSSAPPSAPAAEPAPPEALQRVMKVRRDYNSWVASETLEDYALRFTPRSFRKWSALRVANTAFGAASFLVLEAVGGTLLVEYGFVNAFWAILATALIIFAAGLPISVYAARHGVDMDLLTRGAGFGYIGSTITSLIYASFTFIFFALEAAIMAYALELAFNIPPAWGYLLCALVVIPLVTHGVTVISRLQVWTQPLWLALLVLPYVYVLRQHPHVLSEIWSYGGDAAGGQAAGFDLMRFGSAMTVGVALITQMGEQADYLRFMPDPEPGRRWRWWASVVAGGPGWVLPGLLKMLGGALLAYLAIGYAVPTERAIDPTQMYLVGYGAAFPSVGVAVALTAVFVVVSQLKINVTNAYAGSLAWSNFFARLTHSHPGRVVWVVFNTLIALMLMELGVFQALGKVLGLYSNLAISWIMAVVADLVVNKPLGWSPRGIEFKRAYLYDINPVGVGAMSVASALSIAAHLGAFGPWAQAFSALIAMVTAFVTAPLIAWATRGRYYLARRPQRVIPIAPAPASTPDAPPTTGPYRRLAAPATVKCCICEREYEGDDMAACPAYQGPICSLCCSLDARCHDLCKPDARLSTQWRQAAARLLPGAVWRRLDTELGQYLTLMGLAVVALSLLFASVYSHEAQVIAQDGLLHDAARDSAQQALRMGLLKVFATFLVISAVVVWWLVLKHKSALVAQEESNRQTHLLVEEIDSHRRTDEALQRATHLAEAAKAQADAANQAKSRYITAISHELRTPLNSILGYAQLLDEDAGLPPQRKHAVQVIKRGGDHLLSLIEGTLDIAHIESGKLRLDTRPMRFVDGLLQIAHLFELQAAAKGITFRFGLDAYAPAVARADERRLRQILINILGNAVKFTSQGEVIFSVKYAREMATFEVRDSGPGIAPDELRHIFEPFERGASASQASTAGTGLGLTIAKMLTELMGGEITVDSQLGVGTTFRVKLYLPALHPGAAEAERPAGPRLGYSGPRCRVLVVDNEEDDRGLLVNTLEPLGFELREAASGEDCLRELARWQPDAIFMDLAMPGIDGWETIRRIRAHHLTEAAIAIVSANAFDKGLDNDVGIAPDDFFVKPVRKADLLDWLGRRLELDWIEQPAPADAEASATADAAPVTLPGAAQLQALQDQVELGYVRGIMRRLDLIEAEEPACQAFVDRLRPLARQFQLDAIHTILKQARADATPHHTPAS